MTMTKDQIIALLETQEAKDIKTVLAYIVKKTATVKDDQILENANQIAEVLAQNLSEIADQNPSDKDVRAAGMRILKSIAKQTETKIDDAVLNMVDWFI